MQEMHIMPEVLSLPLPLVEPPHLTLPIHPQPEPCFDLEPVIVLY